MAGGSERPWSTVWLVAAASAGFAAGAAEPGAPDTDWTAITEPLLSSIEAEEARSGPFSAELVGLLTSLGLAYQENGEHVLAVAVLDRALSLKRINEGLFGLYQVPLVERLIDSERAIGRTDTAEDLESRLLDLARRNYNDPRAAPIFRDAAERRLALYERYLRGEIPGGFSLHGSPTARDIAAGSVRGARRHYNEAIGVLIGNAVDHRTELEELEEALTWTYYLEASDRRRLYQGVDDWLYGMGLVSYQRRIGYTAAGYPNVVDYARTLVELADWSLLFSRNGTAVRRYAEAYSLLVERNAPAAAIEELFPSATPVFLPAFAPTPFESAAAGAAGYVDVDFEVGKYGQPRKVTIVAAAGDGASDVAGDLTAALSRGRFRPSPLPDAGRATPYRLRYTLADGSLTPRL
jgi:tetratricopeptide (TPR) repeat protein